MSPSRCGLPKSCGVGHGRNDSWPGGSGAAGAVGLVEPPPEDAAAAEEAVLDCGDHAGAVVVVVLDFVVQRPLEDQRSDPADGIAILETAVPEGEEPVRTTFSEKFACPVSGFTIPEIEPRLFSFNAPFGACPACDGLGVELFFDERLVVPDVTLKLKDGALAPWAKQVDKDTMAGAITAYDKEIEAFNTAIETLKKNATKLLKNEIKPEDLDTNPSLSGDGAAVYQKLVALGLVEERQIGGRTHHQR